MPFLHLHIDATGRAKACCISSIDLGNFKNSSLHEIWNSEQINLLRNRFLNDEADSRCKNCYTKEASGNDSLRTETLKKYQDLTNEIVQNPTPLYFDIRFSNICNLKCRTCWHGNSSKWFEDAKALNRNLGDKSLIRAFPNKQEFHHNFESYLKSAVEFYFAGGEPLLMEEHLWVLDGLLKENNTHCLLRYNTNLGSLNQFNQDLTNQWKKFDQIEILASIDGLGDKGKSIRSGINLKQFEDNFKKLKALPNIRIKIAPTFSLLSAPLLPELHQHFYKQQLIGVNDVHFNILHQPYFYNVKTLPFDQKEKIETMYQQHIEWIKKLNGDATDWENAIQYMNSEHWHNRYEKTKQETNLLNTIRDEKLELDF